MSGNVHNKKTVLIKLKLKAIDKKAWQKTFFK